MFGRMTGEEVRQTSVINLPRKKIGSRVVKFIRCAKIVCQRVKRKKSRTKKVGSKLASKPGGRKRFGSRSD